MCLLVKFRSLYLICHAGLWLLFNAMWPLSMLDRQPVRHRNDLFSFILLNLLVECIKRPMNADSFSKRLKPFRIYRFWSCDRFTIFCQFCNNWPLPLLVAEYSLIPVRKWEFLCRCDNVAQIRGQLTLIRLLQWNLLASNSLARKLCPKCTPRPSALDSFPDSFEINKLTRFKVFFKWTFYKSKRFGVQWKIKSNFTLSQ